MLNVTCFLDLTSKQPKMSSIKCHLAKFYSAATLSYSLFVVGDAIVSKTEPPFKDRTVEGNRQTSKVDVNVQ